MKQALLQRFHRRSRRERINGGQFTNTGRKPRLVAEVSLALPREIDLSKDTVIGRDKSLHVFHEGDWYVFPIDSVN
jgi:hypothetical protein